MDASLDSQKKNLEQLRMRLLDSQAQSGSTEKEQTPSPPNDEPSFEAEQSNSNADKLRRIEASLERIASGRYGFCTKCDNKIQHDRLHNLPYAEYCLPCQRQHENTIG